MHLGPWHSRCREWGWDIPVVPGPPPWRGPYLAEPDGDEAIAGAHPEQPGVLVVLVSQDALQGTGDTAVSIAASCTGHTAWDACFTGGGRELPWG